MRHDPLPVTDTGSSTITEIVVPDRSTLRRWAFAFLGAVAVGSVLRLWGLAHPTLIPDESYSAMAAHRLLLDIPGHIATTDPHPPLSYLLLWPVVHLSQAEWALRLTSALPAVGSLVLMAWWQVRRADRFAGWMAVVLFATMPFQMTLTREARMYGLMILLGVAGAGASWRWLERPSRAVAVFIGVVAWAAAMSHAMGFILGMGMILVPGLRRDRDAWELRAAVGVAGALVAAMWGRTLLSQSGGSLYRTTTISQLATTLNELIVAVPGNRIVMLPLVALGGALLWRLDRHVGQVWLCLFAIPVGVVALMGLFVPMVIPKTFMVVSWGPPVALAACISAAWRRWRPLGATVLALVAFLTVPFLPDVLRPVEGGTEATQPLVDALHDVVRPGDAVAIHPLATLVPWYFGNRPGDPATPIDLDLPGTTAWVPGGGQWTGRVWLVDTLFAGEPVAALQTQCAPPQVIGGDYQVRCLDLRP